MNSLVLRTLSAETNFLEVLVRNEDKNFKAMFVEKVFSIQVLSLKPQLFLFLFLFFIEMVEYILPSFPVIPSGGSTSQV